MVEKGQQIPSQEILQKRVVIMEKYNPQWPSFYEQEVKRLLRGIPGFSILETQHVGSTSIPNTHAKPIIDIVAGVPTIDVANNLISPLEVQGYTHFPSQREYTQRRFLARYLPTDSEVQGYHLLFYTPDDSFAARQIGFRDFFLANPAIAQAYSRKKQELASLYATDSFRYSEEKNKWLDQYRGAMQKFMPDNNNS